MKIFFLVWFLLNNIGGAFEPSSIPVAVVTCCDAYSLNQTLLSLTKVAHFQPTQLFLFQDAAGKYEDVDNLISRFIDEKILIKSHLFRHEHSVGDLDNHVRIARHYQHMFTTFFTLPELYPHVIVLEDDLLVSKDFLEYFAVTSPLVHTDRTLFSVSAWNDHGFEGMVKKASEIKTIEAGGFGIHRANHFPGLGWLCTRALWLELKDQWPDFVWDVWTRLPEINKGRHTLIPEIPRTHHIGRSGSSMHLVNFDKWFGSMILHDNTDWPHQKDLSFLLSLEEYKRRLDVELNKSIVVESFWDIYDSQEESAFSVCYDPTVWRELSQYLGLWPHIPLPSLPIRGITFDGVTRIRWRVGEALHTVFLVSSTANHCMKAAHLDQKLPPPPRPTLPVSLRIRVSGRGESCSQACATRGLWCSPDVLSSYGGHLANHSEAHAHVEAMSCAMLVESFGAQCTGGCIAVPKEESTPADHVLPSLWHDQGTRCLVSPLPPSSFDCARSMPDAQRLCPCVLLA